MRPIGTRVLAWVVLAVCWGSTSLAGQWSWSDVPRVVSVADVHGAYDELEGVLRATKLIDDQGEWIGGTTHLVSTGDLVDRGAESRKVLDLLMRLVDEAPRSGGRVHVLLGNHEAMVLAGDRRYVNPVEYGAFREDEPATAREAAAGADRPPGFYGYLAAFSPEGAYGRWLLGRNAVIRIDGVVFVHGGLAPVLGELGGEEANRRLAEELRNLVESQQALVRAGVLPAEAELHEQVQVIEDLLRDPAAGAKGEEILAHARRVRDYDRTLAFAADGPLWYRGTAENPEGQERAVVDAALRGLEARMAVLGHSVTPDFRVRSRFGGRVVLADTGMLVSYYGGRAAALELTGGRVMALYPAEGVEEPPRPLDAPASSESAAEAARRADADIESFLLRAPIVDIKEIGSGITNPKRLTLREGTREMRAVFKTVDAVAGSAAASTDLLARINQSDRWHYEIAAYRLDRMLCLGLVPVAVTRTVEGEEGVAQLWIEGAIDERERASRGLKPTDQAAFDAQYKLMRIFDALIYNEDRHQGNVLYTADWKVHAIDHSRAFRTRTSWPPELRDKDLTPPPELTQRLAALDAKTLKAELGDLLESIQIRALLKRRDQILRKKRRSRRSRRPRPTGGCGNKPPGSPRPPAEAAFSPSSSQDPVLRYPAFSISTSSSFDAPCSMILAG